MAEIILTGGGTGGHLYPALAVAERLQRLAPEVGLLYVGNPERIEGEVAPASGLRFVGVPSAGLSPNPLKSLHALWQTARAFGQLIRVFDREKPRVVLATGGYVCAPVLMACLFKRVPYVLHEQNVYPGKVNRWFARHAKRVATSLPGTEAYLPAACSERFGNPVRAGVTEQSTQQARRVLGFADDSPLLLVTGGSQGARVINRAVTTLIPELLNSTRWSVLFVTGQADHAATVEALREHCGTRLQIHAFLQEMPTAIAACELAISRAGATTIAELSAAGRPMILVPYPHAGGHQGLNARALVEAGAAVVVDDHDCQVTGLSDTLFPLLRSAESLCSMAEASRRTGRPEAADKLAKLLLSLL